MKKPLINNIARLVNCHFLQSDYIGKDWESVRKDIIKDLTDYFSQIKGDDICV